MEFRPCIDIHNGQVKQIVGGSLTDQSDKAEENFVSCQDAASYAEMYRELKIKGGHVILLNGPDSDYYEATRRQALSALREYPQGLQAGGGITPENACEYLDAGASHVIVTSYVFRDGAIHYDRLDELVKKVGKEHLVLDLSCRRSDGRYRVVTDRWQKISRQIVEPELLDRLSQSCDEFLIHAVDVEGKAQGIETELVKMLGSWSGITVTYAGGVHNYQDLMLLKELGQDRLNVTIGSALDLFGGSMSLSKVLELTRKQ